MECWPSLVVKSKNCKDRFQLTEGAVSKACITHRSHNTVHLLMCDHQGETFIHLFLSHCLTTDTQYLSFVHKKKTLASELDSANILKSTEPNRNKEKQV